VSAGDVLAWRAPGQAGERTVADLEHARLADEGAAVVEIDGRGKRGVAEAVISCDNDNPALLRNAVEKPLDYHPRVVGRIAGIKYVATMQNEIYCFGRSKVGNRVKHTLLVSQTI
jgi:hypothetical protein